MTAFDSASVPPAAVPVNRADPFPRMSASFVLHTCTPPTHSGYATTGTEIVLSRAKPFTSPKYNICGICPPPYPVSISSSALSAYAVPSPGVPWNIRWNTHPD